MTANAETKILPNAISLSCLVVCSIMPSSGDGTAHRAPSFRLEPNTHIPAAAGVADEVHGSPAAVLCRSICWVLALGPPWRGKKISGGPPGPFLLFDSGSSIRISRVVEVLALAFNYGLAKPIADIY